MHREKGNAHPDGPLMIPAPDEARDKEERKNKGANVLELPESGFLKLDEQTVSLLEILRVEALREAAMDG